MMNFAASYPAFAALLSLVANLVQDMEAPNETMLQKLEGSIGLVPVVLAFLPQASLLGPELVAIKASPLALEQGAELLVTDLAFSSAKAKAIIAAAFPVAEAIVGMVPGVQALAAAIKA